MVSSVGEKMNVNVYETSKVVTCDANFYNIQEHNRFIFSIESSTEPLRYECMQSNQTMWGNVNLSFKGKMYFSDYC